MDTRTHVPVISLEQVISMLEIYQQTAETALDKEPENSTARQMAVLSENALTYLRLYRRSIPSFEYIKDAYIKSKLEMMQVVGRKQ